MYVLAEMSSSSMSVIMVLIAGLEVRSGGNSEVVLSHREACHLLQLDHD